MFVSCQRQLLSTNAYCGSAYGAVLAKKSGMAGTNKTQIGSELENLETRYTDQQFTNSPEFNEAYRFKLLRSLMNLRKICLNRIILWWMRVEWRTLTLLVPLCFHLVGCRWKKESNYLYLFIRACIHVGRGPQAGEGPQLVKVTPLNRDH